MESRLRFYLLPTAALWIRIGSETGDNHGTMQINENGEILFLSLTTMKPTERFSCFLYSKEVWTNKHV
jgi:hypothetical protein